MRHVARPLDWLLEDRLLAKLLHGVLGPAHVWESLLLG